MDGGVEMFARENNLIGIVDIPLNQLKQEETPKRTITILPATPNMKLNSPTEPPATVNPTPILPQKEIDVAAFDEQKPVEYISLTAFARSHHPGNPSYVIQSWMRSENTLAFLDLWEQENNPAYNASAYAVLLEKKKTASFTVTAKQWIEQTRAIGITSKQGKQGGTFAHPLIASEFATWLSPRYMMQVLKMAEFEEDFFKVER